MKYFGEQWCAVFLFCLDLPVIINIMKRDYLTHLKLYLPHTVEVLCCMV